MQNFEDVMELFKIYEGKPTKTFGKYRKLIVRLYCSNILVVRSMKKAKRLAALVRIFHKKDMARSFSKVIDDIVGGNTVYDE